MKCVGSVSGALDAARQSDLEPTKTGIEMRRVHTTLQITFISPHFIILEILIIYEPGNTVCNWQRTGLVIYDCNYSIVIVSICNVL